MKAQQSNFVKLLEQRGPKIKQIAAELGVNAETARFWFKKSILGHTGFFVGATPNYRELGLRRYTGFAELTEEARPFAKEIFFLLYNLAGFAYYSKILPSGNYHVQFNVPFELEGRYSRFFERLTKTGLFSKMELRKADWLRRFPMKAHLFDFRKGWWAFEWRTIQSERPLAIPELTSRKAVFDRKDLDLLVELQTNASQSIADIASYLQMDYYEAFRHYRHIIRSGLVDYYRVNWPGSGQKVRSEDPKVSSLHRHPHRLFGFILLLENLPRSQFALVQSEISKLPFSWVEQGGPEFYYAQLYVPTDYYHETLQFLEPSLRPVAHKLTFQIEDMTDAAGWTIPNQLFNAETKSWQFDEEAALSKLEKLLIRTRA